MVVLSLFVSSIAACGCSHHQERAETAAPSCHRHSGEMNQSAETSATIDSDENCVCVQSAPRVLAKSGIVKIEKQAAATVSPNVAVLIELTVQVTTVKTSDYSKPFYLSDSFYNIKSPRAPPVL